MCGILGGIWAEKSVVDTEKVKQALNAIEHRGPDDQGYEKLSYGSNEVILGHTRLSILDLSTAGHQPMFSSDQRFIIVFNGEVYNFKEVRDELKAAGKQFISETDTEVLVEAWAYWGRACLSKFEGMFAFVVFDTETGVVVCARDAFGIKPFFYYYDTEKFIFSSELKALQILLGGEVKLNKQRCYDYLVHADYDSSEATFIDGVQHLRPAHYFEINLNTEIAPKPKQWWSPSTEKIQISFEEAVKIVRNNFLESVRLHLRSDVAVGAALSGGIDSSAIVCAMRYIEPEMKINTFSYIADTEALSEEGWVDIVNEFASAKAHKIYANSADLVSDLPKMIEAQGEPFSTTSIYAQYRVFQAAKDAGVVVTLDGQGADELHAGYLGYPGQRVKSLLETFNVLGAWRFICEWSKLPGRTKKQAFSYFIQCITPRFINTFARKVTGRRMVPKWFLIDKLQADAIKFEEPIYVSRGFNAGRSVVEQLKSSISKRGLVGLLRHADRNSMAFSLESRVPFLTMKQANFLLSLPEEYLVSHSGESKHILREALRGIVPDCILERKDKIGFATPEADWLKEQSGLIYKWLNESDYPNFLCQKQVISYFDDFVLGENDDWKHIWRLINFIKWYSFINGKVV